LLNGGSGSTAQPPWSSLGLFFQDDWKVSPRLTLNLGLRWDANIDFLTPQLTTDFATSNKGIYDLRQIAANPAFPADTQGGQAILSIVGNTGNLNRSTSDWKEFQPRVGFAWDITGTGKHLLRGGYGIARDQIFQNITLWSIQQSQPTIYQAVFDAIGSVAPGTGNCANVGTGPVNPCTFQFGVTPLPTPPPPTTDLAFGATPRLTNPRITDPWSQQFGLGYAWQINSDFAFSADYVHILGTHEERVWNMNPTIKNVCDPLYGGLQPTDPTYSGLCPAGISTRLMDQAFVATGAGAGRFNKIYDYSTNNRSFYDGINLQLRKRMSKHMMFQVSDVISWSRSWGGFPVASYGGSGLAIVPWEQFLPNEFNYTNFDERNRFVASGVFNLPWGFSLAPIFTAASARPYSFIAGNDINGDGRIALDRVCVGSTLTNPITTDGCTMIKPNTLRGIPFVQMNLRVDKSFNLGERAQILLYWEFYNLFNRSNFCNSYEESSKASNFNKPQSYCNGPSNAAYAGISGFGAAAIPSLSSQFGFRFNF
jgi:outer membrane receptor protein involved in Fe transport